MEVGDLTLKWISDNIGFILVLCGGMYAIYKGVKSAIKKLLEDEFEALNKRIEGLEAQTKSIDMETTKNFLVRYLADVEKGSVMTEIESERFWEQYEHYLKMDGNSYIKEWVAKLQKKGWL